MASPGTKDNATKARIINHMNSSHTSSLSRYLQHYSHLSLWKSHPARLITLDLNGLLLSCGGTETYRIPFNPPLNSLAETRERVVEMDKECLAALGREEMGITEFLPATGIWAVPFVAISCAFIAFSQRWWFAPHTLPHSLLGARFSNFLYAVQPYILAFMLFMHAWEGVYFMYYKLVKFNVNPRTRLFWLWTGTAFLEGGFAFMRFNGLVESKRVAKAKLMH
ncbi:hypothetical protein LTR62_004490 [Meristemomyces frigidus]|uniref:DUF2470 domain-containing protein n=1 Tax=Meristemomyces frigidus TaxID=1508187 RepID=A0AAN7YP61_9PEZI|nr:hypothetical protein LTR62_004490 [Meristemomyces frigidus]